MKQLKILALLILFACGSEDPSIGSVDLKYGQSFGFCIGYCQSELTFDKLNAVLIQRSNQDETEIKTNTYLTSNQVADIYQLFDEDSFAQLPETIGCPDCADGGAEYLEARVNGEWKKVTFQYNQAPEEIGNLILELRKIHESLTQN